MQLPVEKEESQMFMANSTCWLSSAFHIVTSFTFITCSTALCPLACDLVSQGNFNSYPLWKRNFTFSGINLKAPYLANNSANLTSSAIQTQKFQLPWSPHMPRRAPESEAGWLAQVRAEATDSRMGITFGVGHDSLCKTSKALDWRNMLQSKR